MPGISTPPKAECQTKRKHRDEEGGPQAAGLRQAGVFPPSAPQALQERGWGLPEVAVSGVGPGAALAFTGESLLQTCVSTV